MNSPEMRENIRDDCLIHESAYVDEGAKIGKGAKIWHFCHIMADAEIGESCNIGQNVVIMSGAKIGNSCKVQNNVSLYTAVECEDDVFLGPSCVFTNVFNPRAHINRKAEYRSTLVKKGATVGANATIICGCVIGRYAFIGAGAVVTRDVPNYALVYGNPAAIRGWMCECGIKLEFPTEDGKASCTACGKKYTKSGKDVKQDD